MKKLTPLLLGSLMAASSLQAGFYLRGGLFYHELDDIEVSGLSEFASDLSANAGFTAAVGYQFTALRLEAEINYQDADIGNTSYIELITSGELERSSIFANLLFEMPGTPFFEPYLGAGVGVSDIQLDYSAALNPLNNSNDVAFNSSADESLFGFQLMAGVRFSLMDTVSVYAGYRYLLLESVTVNEGSYTLSPQEGSHLIEIGAGLGF